MIKWVIISYVCNLAKCLVQGCVRMAVHKWLLTHFSKCPHWRAPGQQLGTTSCWLGAKMASQHWFGVTINCYGQPQSDGADSISPHSDGFIVFSPAFLVSDSLQRRVYRAELRACGFSSLGKEGTNEPKLRIIVHLFEDQEPVRIRDRDGGEGASQVAQWKRIHLPRRETQVQPLGWKDPPEKERATYSSVLAWEITWTKEPGRIQSMGLQKVSDTT